MSSAVPRPLEATVHPSPMGRIADYVALTKPRMNLLIVATSVAGFYLGTEGSIDFSGMAATALGTALVAGGAGAFNQLFERDTDGLMRRTHKRPLPDGRLQPTEAAWFAATISVLGLLQLAVGNNIGAAVVALATLLFYTVIYTPLKMRSWTATLVGAVPGALPPVIGWTAAHGSISEGAVALFAIVFCWQIPHFFAIAWMYREEYARAGFPFLPIIEPEGHRTARQVVGFTVALIAVSLTPLLIGLAGWGYGAAAAGLGAISMVEAVRFSRQRTHAAARRLFLWSLIYLPLIWAAMMLDT
ncbi:MAG: protoheme IX farnesyltransferase [Acidobacteria bacterium]|nr:protoheme IX farnesyltransferase [Acidobacteriota bacterium]